MRDILLSFLELVFKSKKTKQNKVVLNSNPTLVSSTNI